MTTLGEIERRMTGRHPNGISDGIHLAHAITKEVRRTGKHFLPQPFLHELCEIRRRHATDGRPFLQAFLDCLLDKHEGRYWNRTYLSLPLLELLLKEPAHSLGPNRLATLLIADVVRHETQTSAVDQVSDADPPEPAVVRKRLRHALRFVDPGLLAPSRRTDVSDLLPRPPATQAGGWFDVTVQPVYVLHDEYFFIRVLQAHEMLFTAITEDIRKTIAALREKGPVEAAGHMDRATSLFDRAAALFRIVATMRPAHFLTFRQFTQGASALQSEQYKRFEILCGVPPAPRLRSAAFTSVPAVRAEAEAPGHDTVVRAWLDLRQAGRFAEAEWHVLDAALNRLEATHHRWKSTHRSLAARMLGSARGSGHTDGVPYLTQCLDNRLFWQLRGS
ncbi:tryptophan 2,3-dioxygenase family protein [Streptomyces sp. enrichment culture]|uniref:tryptophan 2,3-dioxygenase family protein n=1 Tax=Streptomyces sp. enrichment culture TaxID=1795815 RepID=UPI003F5787B9